MGGRGKGEAAAAEKQQKEAMKEEEDEKNVLVGQEAKWKNRTGSSKEKGRRKWAEHKAKEEGEDVEVCKLGALGSSRMKRLITRQQDRLTVKEAAEAAERAAKQANEAAQAAQNTAQLAAWSWQPWQSQQYQQQQDYCWPLYSWNQGQVFFGLNCLFFDWHMFPHLPNKFKYVLFSKKLMKLTPSKSTAPFFDQDKMASSSHKPMGTMWWTPTTSQPKAMAARVHMAPLAQLLPMAATPPRPMAPQPVAQMEEGLHFS